jgi:uncharacterized protein (TIGR02757 family)
MNASQLLAAAHRFNCAAFVAHDPVCIPHCYSEPGDIEISGWFAAVFAWGRRDLIIRSAQRLMHIMGHEPYRFVQEASEDELADLAPFAHRTFNGTDAQHVVLALRNLYGMQGGLQGVFTRGFAADGAQGGLRAYRDAMLAALPPYSRARKHVPDVDKGSSAKRMCMYLRWMVRKDEQGVDFGLWKGISPTQLALPLDVHTGRVARHLGLLTRKQNDWKAVCEVTARLRTLCPDDPVLLDYALFGLGISGQV